LGCVHVCEKRCDGEQGACMSGECAMGCRKRICRQQMHGEIGKLLFEARLKLPPQEGQWAGGRKQWVGEKAGPRSAPPRS
jgi:hypothetical protein